MTFDNEFSDPVFIDFLFSVIVVQNVLLEARDFDFHQLFLRCCFPAYGLGCFG